MLFNYYFTETLQNLSFVQNLLNIFTFIVQNKATVSLFIEHTLTYIG